MFVFVGSFWFVYAILSAFWGFLQEAQMKAKNLEEEIGRLQKRLEHRNEKLEASASTAEKVPLTS